ncbi:MAG: trans-sulfuration enzyme family protein [Chitinophagaceae bacterium]
MHSNTRIIHEDNIKEPSGGVVSPLVFATSFERGEDGISLPGGYLYSRYDNPNRHALESKLAKMEQGVACISFASGLAAATAVFQSLKSGDHILLPDDCYFSVKTIVNKLFAGFGLSCSAVDMSDPHKVEAAIQPNTKLIWIETPSNPMLKIADIEALVLLAKKHQCFTVADNTWATPYHTLPLLLGVDIILHSTTKYLGGHSDILGGALIFRETNERYEFIRAHQQYGGAVPAPFDCWLLCRSIQTFHARMPIHNTNAMELATYLEKHPAIKEVRYPGLASHPQHALAAKQMQNGFGGMLSIRLKAGKDAALKTATSLKLFAHATSLGGVESLIEHRQSTEGPDTKTPDDLLRVSVGIENAADLIADFEATLSKI